MYDIIGDIHGHADELVRLLELLGYSNASGTYRHPERKVIFLGDFIDRGPKIRETLAIVRPMVANGHALAVMGNHELNALAYHTEDRDAPGKCLRDQDDKKNKDQHQATLNQLAADELCSSLEWFRSLPLWLDLDGLRVVHACWDERAMVSVGDMLQRHGGLTDQVLHLACRKGNPLFASVETILKGKEAELPAGKSYLDADGHPRTAIRTRWYVSPKGQKYKDYALHAHEIDCDDLLDAAIVSAAVPYPAEAKPVFVGHYWLKAERPTVLAPNVACVDYSVAKGGMLCAYRWNGERTLGDENFFWVMAGETRAK